jgi:hypothetical protein
LAACSFDADLVPGYQCGEGGSCPTGQRCVDDYCVVDPDPPDAGGGELDAMSDAAVPGARCGTISLLQDDFADGAFEWFWDPWGETGATVDETGGEVVIDIAAGGSDNWAGITAARWFDLRDGVFEAEVLELGGRATVVEVRNRANEYAQVVGEDGMLVAAVYGVADDGIRVEIPYVPAMHRYWRLREAGGILYWEASPDRVDWTAFHSEPLPFAPEHVRGMLAAGGQLATATTARFGDVNLGVAGGAFCPASDLVDGFDDGPLAPWWDPYSDPECAVLELLGDLTFTYPADAAGDCGILSEHLYDLRNSAVTVDASGVPADPSLSTFLHVQLPYDSNTRLQIEQRFDELDVEQQVAGSDISNEIVPLDPIAHRWWRIRGAGGEIFLETSPDGADWTAIVREAAAFDLSMVRIELGTSTGPPGPAADLLVTFEQVN